MFVIDLLLYHRKDGEELVIDKSSKSVYHDTVMVDIQPNYKSQETDNKDMEVLMVSLAYKSGEKDHTVCNL